MASGCSEMNAENAARLERLESEVRRVLDLLSSEGIEEAAECLAAALAAPQDIEFYGDMWSDRVIANELDLAEENLADVKAEFGLA